MAKLDPYRRKRDFSITSEPEGKVAQTPGRSFVIQKHAARRLHYDFRLEMDGVLKSWAVTKGPSLVPGEKRLAVHVEDHPLDYGGFEGNIPKGQYGGGAVILWDRGQWQPLGDADKGYAKGHLEFELQGEKLTGRWHLVRMQKKPNEKRENWLLIKGDDEAARGEDAPDILEERPESVASGRSVEEVAAEAEEGAAPKRRPKAKAAKAQPAPEIDGAKKAKMPDFVQPALATLRAKAPEGEGWIHEIKFDGYRLQAHIAEGQVKLLTRSGLDWTDRFGDGLIAALKALPVTTALIDGEVVVEGGNSASSFSALQADLSEGRTDRFVFYAFDLMYLDGFDLRQATLQTRKSRLAAILPDQGPVRFSSDFTESGDLVLRHACRLSLEGIVSKRLDAPYRSGRGKSWIKSKCSDRQEFVVGGYVPSSATDKAIGSLVLGVYRDGALHHIGRVGTGFKAKVARDLFRQLQALETPDSPFAEKLDATQRRGVQFVQPRLVAEVEFRAWTADGHLRHASFRGLREDKPATEVVQESQRKDAAAPRRRVTLTHPDRIYWPEAGVTKEGLADYYTDVWPYMAPLVVGRPLALVRAPSGITGQRFFQKHARSGLNKHVRQIADPKDKGGEKLISIDDLDGLIGLVQSGALEIHPWGAMNANLGKPDSLTMDLDPGEGVSWQAVIDAAQEVRARLEAAGLNCFVKTSGGKGLHVVAPLKPKASWTALKAFTKAIAAQMAADEPDRFVATITKSKRKGRILIDYLRNQRGATTVAAYSSRAREGAPVSMPLAWEELSPQIGPDHFTVLNATARLNGLVADPWQDFLAAAVPLPAGKGKAD